MVNDRALVLPRKNDSKYYIMQKVCRFNNAIIYTIENIEQYLLLDIFHPAQQALSKYGDILL